MKHVKALGIKWIIIVTIMFSLFGIFHNVSLASLLFMSIIVTGASYVLGDLLLLPRIGNVFATLADFGLSFVLFGLLSIVLIETTFPITLASLAAAFFTTSIEPLFHAYMQEKVFPIQRAHLSFPLSHLQTETSEEIDPDIQPERNNESKE